MAITIRSSRTKLRRPRLEDVDCMLEMETDPEVYKYLAPGRPFTREQVLQRMQKDMEAQPEREPFGTWIAVDSKTEEFIAWFMLMKFRSENYELGYVVRKKFWGQGYGSEIAKTLVDFGFEQGLDKIMAVTSTDHSVSGKLLTKIGFTFQGMTPVEGENIELRLFEIERPL